MAATLNQAQLQILDMMSFIKSEDTLKELKQVISDFFARWKSRSCLTPEGKVLLTPCNHLSLPPLKS